MQQVTAINQQYINNYNSKVKQDSKVENPAKKEFNKKALIFSLAGLAAVGAAVAFCALKGKKKIRPAVKLDVNQANLKDLLQNWILTKVKALQNM